MTIVALIWFHVFTGVVKLHVGVHAMRLNVSLKLAIVQCYKQELNEDKTGMNVVTCAKFVTSSST